MKAAAYREPWCYCIGRIATVLQDQSIMFWVCTVVAGQGSADITNTALAFQLANRRNR